VEGSFGQDNEISGSVKFWEIIEWLSDWRLLKEELAFMQLVVLVYNSHRYVGTCTARGTKHKIFANFIRRT
jgi:hypothetical protein